MKISKEGLKFWEEYNQKLDSPVKDVEIIEGPAGTYEITDELLALYINGKKTAGSSLLKDYEVTGDALPVPEKLYWIVLDSNKAPRVLLKTVRVERCVFKDIPESVAIAEGEGDLSLEYWRRVHIEFFTPFLQGWGVKDLEEEIVITEYFEVVHFKKEDCHQNEVFVESYKPEWKRNFKDLRDLIWPKVKGSALKIEHVGSTSVEGLSAKPVIDIDIIVKDKEASQKVIKALELIGFKHRGDLGIEGREAFTQLAGFQKHNLYVCLEGSLALRNHLLFRDYLRGSPGAVVEYSKVKEKLASETQDMGEYIEGKTSFILGVLAKAGVDAAELKSIEGVNKQ